MTTSIALNDLVMSELDTVQVTTDTINKDTINLCAKVKEENVTLDYEKILSMTSLSIKMFANSFYKASEFLEPSDIEQIKESLNNYANNNEKVEEFKNAILNDLTKFQKQIKVNHVQKIAELERQKQLSEKNLRVIEYEKKKLVMDRLSKVIWPYDAKTKEFDVKIASLQLQVQKYAQKIEELVQKRPAANEKEILLYRMYLNEKYKQKM